MATVFLVCAVVGGTILFCQLALTLIGLSGEAFDVDVGGDVDTDIDADLGGDFDADVAGDLDGEVAHGDHHVDSTSFFGVISFRTVVAALTFFGIAGLAARSAEARPLTVWIVALGAGAAAMYGVYWMMRAMKKLKAEGTVQIRRAIGKFGTVYLAIPGGESGTGKIQVSVQNRTAEYLAMTRGRKLPTGSKIVVTGVITPTTVEVEPALEEIEPALENERSDHV